MKKGSRKSSRGASQEFLKYCEARAIAAHIAQRDRQDPDVVFSDAMHVAVALALEDAAMAYTRPNVAWMFERISPREVHEVLLYRRNHAEDYNSLPRARFMERLNAIQIDAANAVATSLTPAQLDAFFFGDVSGSA